LFCLLLAIPFSLVSAGGSGYKVGVGIWDMTGPSVEVYSNNIVY